MSIPSTTAAAAAKKVSRFVKVPSERADEKFNQLTKDAPLDGETRETLASTWLKTIDARAAVLDTYEHTVKALLPKCYSKQIRKEYWEEHAEEFVDVLLLPYSNLLDLLQNGPLGELPSEEHKVWKEKKTQHELKTAQLLVEAGASQPKKGAVGMLKGFLFGASEEQTPLEKHGSFDVPEPPKMARLPNSLCLQIANVQPKYVACNVSMAIRDDAKRQCSEIQDNAKVLEEKGIEKMRALFLECEESFKPGEDGKVDLERIEKLQQIMYAYDMQRVSTDAMGLGPAIFQQMAAEKDPRKLAQFMRTAAAFKIIDNGPAVAWLKQYNTAVGGVGVRVYGAAPAL